MMSDLLARFFRKRTTSCLLVLLVLSCPKPLSAAAEGDHTISVQGDGEASAAPDQIRLRIGINLRDSKVEELRAKGQSVMKKLIAAAKEFKVESRDIKTDTIQLDRTMDGMPPGGEGSNMFGLNQVIEFRIRDLKIYDDFVASMFRNGANTIQGFEFETSKRKDLKTQALKGALEDAKRKAEFMAENLGVKLGRVVRIREGRDESWPIASGGRALAAMADSSSLGAGSVAEIAQVVLVMEIEGK